jgi:pimeloyl-ACP methyl ester carboxylesterase
LRRNPLVFGGAFVDRTLLDGDFEEFFLRPLAQPRVRNAAVRLLKTFDTRKVDQLADVHRRIDVPVQLVWGARDLIFPVARAREMVASFPDARLEVVDGAAIFSHEERPAEVARALLKVLV